MLALLLLAVVYLTMDSRLEECQQQLAAGHPPPAPNGTAVSAPPYPGWPSDKALYDEWMSWYKPEVLDWLTNTRFSNRWPRAPYETLRKACGEDLGNLYVDPTLAEAHRAFLAEARQFLARMRVESDVSQDPKWLISRNGDAAAGFLLEAVGVAQKAVAFERAARTLGM